MRISVQYQLFHLVIYFFKCITKLQTWGTGWDEGMHGVGQACWTALWPQPACPSATLCASPARCSQFCRKYHQLHFTSDHTSVWIQVFWAAQTRVPSQHGLLEKGKHKGVMWAILPADENTVPAVMDLNLSAFWAAGFFFLRVIIIKYHN